MGATPGDQLTLGQAQLLAHQRPLHLGFHRRSPQVGGQGGVQGWAGFLHQRLQPPQLLPAPGQGPRFAAAHGGSQDLDIQIERRGRWRIRGGRDAWARGLGGHGGGAAERGGRDESGWQSGAVPFRLGTAALEGLAP